MDWGILADLALGALAYRLATQQAKIIAELAIRIKTLEDDVRDLKGKK